MVVSDSSSTSTSSSGGNTVTTITQPDGSTIRTVESGSGDGGGDSATVAVTAVPPTPPMPPGTTDQDLGLGIALVVLLIALTGSGMLIWWARLRHRERMARLARTDAGTEDVAALRSRLGIAEQRLAVLERIATDTDAPLAREIDALRRPATAQISERRV